MIVVNDDTVLALVDLYNNEMTYFTQLLLSEQVIAKCQSFLDVPACHDCLQTPSTKFL